MLMKTRSQNHDVPLLSIEHLSIDFLQYEKGLQQRTTRVIDDLSLTVKAGEMLAIVGSSGSGKSLLAHAVLGLLPHNATVSGALHYQGEPLSSSTLRALRGEKIALVPQSVQYLDPMMKVGKQVRGIRGSEAAQQAVFEQYGLGPDVANLYPFALSGGMARRVLFATALIENAELVIADEPTPGLSHEMALEVMQNFRRLADEGRGVILITHDLDLAMQVADNIAVFYAGTILELAPRQDFEAGAEALRHPYSKAMIAALPQNGFMPLPGVQPCAGQHPQGCLFAPRCSQRSTQCHYASVSLRPLRQGLVRCLHAT